MNDSLSMMKARLQSYLQDQVFSDRELAMEEFSQASGGWTDETFLLTIKSTTETKGLVVRKLKKDSLLSEERNLSPQYRLLDRLSQSTRLPVPKVFRLEENPSILGAEFMIMEKLEGRSYVPWSEEGRAFFKNKAENSRLPKQFADHLITLHNLNYREYGIQDILHEHDGGTGFIDAKLVELEHLYMKYKLIDDPVMTDALEWLKQNRPSAQRLSILHGDYRTGNMLYKEKSISGILDWEAAELGDPLMDVAYICAKANRMDSPLLCYLLEKDWFLHYYAENTGLTIKKDVLHYFEVLHQVRFLLLSLSAAHSFEKEKSMDLRMGRQGYRWTLMRHLLAETIGY